MDARVVRHESEVGSWELVVRPPAAHLRGLARSYVGYVESSVRRPLVR